jgi:putative transposase
MKDLCRKHGFSAASFYLWRSKFGGMEINEASREAIAKRIDEHQLSERRACKLVRLIRDAYRHPPQMSAQNNEISAHMKETAYQRTRRGYRMIHDVLARKYLGVNHKRVYRLYREAKLAVRKRKSKRRSGVRAPLISSNITNETWSIDLVSDATAKLI